MNVYWSNARPNFGDILTPYVLDYFNIKHKMVKSPSNASAMCIGSIVHRATDNMIVLGSGTMHTKHKLNPNADYRFVRGPLTRKRIIECGGNCPEIYGDPALLLPLFCNESKKEFDVGITPHYVDYELVKNLFPNYKIIKLENANPLDVAKEITKCRTIISSSLHGIIAAHAYGIPAAWVKFSNNIKGDNIKFKDHYAALKLEAKLSSLDDPIFSVGQISLTPIKEVFNKLHT